MLFLSTSMSICDCLIAGAALPGHHLPSGCGTWAMALGSDNLVSQRCGHLSQISKDAFLFLDVFMN